MFLEYSIAILWVYYKSSRASLYTQEARSQDNDFFPTPVICKYTCGNIQHAYNICTCMYVAIVKLIKTL